MAETSRISNPVGTPPEPSGMVRIDCDECAARGRGCRDCVVSVLLGPPETLLDDERAALDVLADAGLAPRLRLVPVRRDGLRVARNGGDAESC